MRPIIRAASGLLLGLCAAQALAITLTPNAIGGGNIPGTYPTVDFQTWDGNWAPVLRLPASAAGGASITFHPNATWSSSLATDNTDLPMRALTLNKGDTITVTTEAPATILYGHADPIGEPVVSHGPFVMNTREEIVRAIEDYNAGLFGKPPVIR